MLKRVDHLLQPGVFLAVSPAQIIQHLKLLDRLVELVGHQIELTRVFIGTPVIGLRPQCPFVEGQRIFVVMRFTITETK
jgi:hypothetical protein